MTDMRPPVGFQHVSEYEWRWGIYVIRRTAGFRFHLYDTDGRTLYLLSEHRTYAQAVRHAKRYARLHARNSGVMP
jgi:hypothetical protein